MKKYFLTQKSELFKVLYIINIFDFLIPNVYDPQTLNRYMFERGNQYGKVDKDGHFFQAVVLIVLGAVLTIALEYLIVSIENLFDDEDEKTDSLKTGTSEVASGSFESGLEKQGFGKTGSKVGGFFIGFLLDAPSAGGPLSEDINQYHFVPQTSVNHFLNTPFGSIYMKNSQSQASPAMKSKSGSSSSGICGGNMSCEQKKGGGSSSSRGGSSKAPRKEIPGGGKCGIDTSCA